MNYIIVINLNIPVFQIKRTTIREPGVCITFPEHFEVGILHQLTLFKLIACAFVFQYLN